MNTGDVAMACQVGGDIASLLASVLVRAGRLLTPGKPYVADGKANTVNIIGLAPFKAVATDRPRMLQRSPRSCFWNPPVFSATGAMRFNRLRMERRQPYDMALRRPPPMASPSTHGGCNRCAGTPNVDASAVPQPPVDGLT